MIGNDDMNNFSTPFKMKTGFTLSTLTIALLTSVPGYTAGPVDGGSNLRELQKEQPAAPKAPVKPQAPLRVEDTAAPKAANNTVKIAIKGVRISGNTVFTSAKLESLVNDLIGSEHTLTDLDIAAQKITEFYRGNGYIVAHAYVPAQDIKDGVVRLEVLEGRVDKKRIDNQSRLSDSRASDYVGVIKQNDVLQADAIDRMLLLLADTAGVASARGALQPGANVGTSDLIVELLPSEPYLASVDVDNYGSPFTGRYRLGGSLAVNSPTGMGDLLSLRAQRSNKNLSYARASYQIPVGNDGWRVGVAYANSTYRLGSSFTNVGSHGDGSSTSVFAAYPVIRTQTTNLSTTFTYEDKKSKDTTDLTNATDTKHTKVGSIGLSANKQDFIGGGGVTVAEFSVYSGTYGADAVTEAADRAGAKAIGSFTRMTYTLSRIQRIDDINMLWFSVTGQTASKNLAGSEKFGLGGPTGVRAFPGGEASGDEGYMANVEWRRQLDTGVQGIVFYDVGGVTVNHNQFNAAHNTRTLGGAGVGVNAAVAGAQVRATLAWRTMGAPTSTVDSSNPRLSVQVSKVF